jgi:guanylate kinase
LSVSYTTRKPRTGELEGVHYHFTTIAEMEEEIKKKNLIEHALVHGNYYGSSKKVIFNILNFQKAITSSKGKCCIFDIDIQGAKQVRKVEGLNPIFIFLYTDIKEIEKRLRGRNSETEEQIQKRLKNGEEELKIGLAKDGLFDYTIENVNIEKTLEEFEKIIERHIFKLN